MTPTVGYVVTWYETPSSWANLQRALSPAGLFITGYPPEYSIHGPVDFKFKRLTA